MRWKLVASKVPSSVNSAESLKGCTGCKFEQVRSCSKLLFFSFRFSLSWIKIPWFIFIWCSIIILVLPMTIQKFAHLPVGKRHSPRSKRPGTILTHHHLVCRNGCPQVKKRGEDWIPSPNCQHLHVTLTGGQQLLQKLVIQKKIWIRSKNFIPNGYTTW